MIVGYKKIKIKNNKESQYTVSLLETGSDSPIGSDRDRGRDTYGMLNAWTSYQSY